MPTATDQTIKHTLKHYAQTAKRLIYLAWGLSLLSVLVLVAQSWILATLLAHWLTQSLLGAPSDSDVFVRFAPWLVVCLLLRPVLHFFKDKLAFRAGLQAASTLRADILTKITWAGEARHHYGSDGSLASGVIEQADTLSAYVGRFYLQRLIVISTPLILLVAAGSQSLIAMLILLLTAPLVPVFMILIGHATARKSREQFAALAQLSGRFLDWLRGMATLKRLQATASASDDIAHSAAAYRTRTMSVLKIAFLNTAVLELLSALSIALLAVYLGFGLIGILPWQKNVVPVAYQSALFLLLLAPEFYAPLRQLGADYHVKAQAQGAIEQLLPLLKHPDPTSDTAKQALTLPNPPAITFTQVSTATGERVRLAPISFSITQGQKVAIIGESGSGKSTLLQILLGFCAYQGDIVINDVDFKTVDMTQFRSQVAYLSQQTMLLPMSIADNLRLPNPNANDDTLWHALEQVGLKNLIAKLPNQLATPLGERGSGLSGGQQRRLAIAQLLLQDTKLWLLDEPTEHLDEQTAGEIHHLLQTLTRDKTVLWVTHHPHHLPWLDQVIALDTPTTQENIAQGSPDEQ